MTFSQSYPVVPAIPGNAGSVSPGSLLETILSAHTVPYRHVHAIWTSGLPLPHFFQWPWADQLGLYVFAAIVILLVLNIRSDPTRRGLVGRLLLAFVASIPFGLGWLVLGPVIAASLYTSYRDIFFD